MCVNIYRPNLHTISFLIISLNILYRCDFQWFCNCFMNTIICYRFPKARHLGGTYCFTKCPVVLGWFCFYCGQWEITHKIVNPRPSSSNDFPSPKSIWRIMIPYKPLGSSLERLLPLSIAHEGFKWFVSRSCFQGKTCFPPSRFSELI